MKKLMIASLAVASCMAYAAQNKVPDNYDPTKVDGVYTLTVNAKYLDYKTVAYKAIRNNQDLPELKIKEVTDPKKVDASSYLVEKVKGKVVSVSPDWYDKIMQKFDTATNTIQQTLLGTAQLVISDYKETKKAYDIYKDGQYVETIHVVTAISFKYQDTSKSNKQVSKNLTGMVIFDQGKQKTYIWDPKQKDTFYNIFAGSKTDAKGKVSTQSLPFALESDASLFEFLPGTAFTDKNAEGGFKWDFAGAYPAYGWASGTVKEDTKTAKGWVISSLAGNYAGVINEKGYLAKGVYGTWKLAYDEASSKILRCHTSAEAQRLRVQRKYDGVDYNTVDVEGKGRAFTPETYEEILGKKKVEIVVD